MREGESMPNYNYAFPISVGDRDDAITSGFGETDFGNGMLGAPTDACEYQYELIQTLSVELNDHLGPSAPKAVEFEQC